MPGGSAQENWGSAGKSSCSNGAQIINELKTSFYQGGGIKQFSYIGP
jgi:hypothetical protein